MGESAAPNPLVSSSKADDPAPSSGFGVLDSGDFNIDENEDFGGLMVCFFYPSYAHVIA